MLHRRPILIISFLSLVFASCSTSYKEEIALIPRDAKMVAQVDINRIADKSGLLDYNFENIKGFLEKQETSEGASFIESLLTNFKSTGISRKSKAFYYLCPISRRQDIHGFVVKLSSPSDFEDFLKTEGGRYGGKVEIKKNALFDQARFERMPKLVVAWNSNSAMAILPQRLYLGAKDRDKFIAKMFTMKKKDQIGNEKTFKKFVEKKNDASVYFARTLFFNRDAQEIHNLFGRQTFEKGDYAEMSINFTEGKVVWKSESHIKNMDTTMAFKTVDSDLIKHVPSDGWVSLASHIQSSGRRMNGPMSIFTDPSAILRDLDMNFLRNMGTSGELRPEMAFSLAKMDKREVIRENFYSRYYADPDEPVRYDTFTRDVPIFQAAFKFQDPVDTMKKRVSMGLKSYWDYDSITEIYKNLESDQGTSYVLLKDDLLFISNDLDYIHSIRKNEPINGLKETNFKGLYTKVDLKKVFTPENIESLKFPESEVFVLIYKKVYEELDELSMRSEGQNGITLELTLSKDDENSLYRIVEAGKEIMEIVRGVQNK